MIQHEITEDSKKEHQDNSNFETDIKQQSHGSAELGNKVDQSKMMANNIESMPENDPILVIPNAPVLRPIDLKYDERQKSAGDSQPGNL